MNYRVTHTTTYSYSEPVALCHNLVHLTPRESPRQARRHSRLTITPEPAVTWDGADYFGNPVTFFTIQEPHRQLTVTAVHVTQVSLAGSHDPAVSVPWEQARDRLRAELDAYQFAFDSVYVKADAGLAEYAAPSFAPGLPLLDAVLDLTRRIHADFRYDPSATTVTTPLRDVLTARRGVCQDFAHLLIGCLRSLELASRYVSGYIRTAAPQGRDRLVGADASHAWVSVFCPGAGWVDVDPTNNLLVSADHVVLGWGRDYDDVSPIKGVILGGGKHTVTVGVDVVPLAAG
jgi:transglutaminase-like putative cysteine protease